MFKAFCGQDRGMGAMAPASGCKLTFIMPHPPHFLPSQVWKDVDGVLTSDPRIVPNTLPVNELTFEEATELAYFGAQVRVCEGL